MTRRTENLLMKAQPRFRPDNSGSARVTKKYDLRGACSGHWFHERRNKIEFGTFSNIEVVIEKKI